MRTRPFQSNRGESVSLFVRARERPEAFGEVFREYHAPVLQFMARRTFDPEVATDLMAETFAHMLANLSRFHGSSDEQGRVWMWTIARNLLTDWYRRGDVETRYLERVGVEPRALEPDEYLRIEELADFRTLREVVRAALSRLRPLDRQVLELRVVEERSYHDIAQMLELTIPAVKIRVSRTLRQLADLLDEHSDAAGRPSRTITGSEEELLT
jgi:RNA polymerase sigma-70 factor (ECF subfamily)